MKFIFPDFLWALLFIAIPILIHILNLRRHRTVYFSNVDFLKKVKRETHKRSKIKQLLILASRIVIIIALVLAFSKPYLPSSSTEHQQANNVVGIYIDNSFSMNAEGTEGIAIESAKQKAFAIVKGSRADTKFALLSNALNDQQNRFYSKNEIIHLIADVETSHNQTLLSTIQLRFQRMMENFLFETNKNIYLISDFQKHSADLSSLHADSVNRYNFIPIPINEVSNLYLDSCWFEAPTHHFEQLEKLHVRIINRSNNNYQQIPVNFYLNDSLKALASTDLAPGEEKIITLQYSNQNKGIQMGRIEISDYPIVYDNTIYLSYEVKSTLNALLIEQNHITSTDNLQALFIKDEYINLNIGHSDKLQISSLSNYSIILLNELKTISSGIADELKKYIENGGTLVVIPNQQIETESYNNLFRLLNAPQITEADTLNIPISNIDYQHPLFSDVFRDEEQKVTLPNINYRYRFTNEQQITETNILTFADKTKALSLATLGNGKIFTFAFPLSIPQNQFIDHLLFIPTFYNMVLQSSYAQKPYYTIGYNQSIELKSTSQKPAQNLLIKQINSGQEFIPSLLQQKGNTLRIAMNENFEAGFQQLYSNNELINSFAINYQLKESDLDYYTSEQIKLSAQKAEIKNISIVEAKSENLTSTIKELDNGKQLWKLFIIIALFFLLIEAAIIRFWP
jgi:hypothetical protein